MKTCAESTAYESCSDVVVTGCTISSRSTGLCIGSELASPVEWYVFSSCIIPDSNRRLALQLAEPGLVRDVTFTDIIADPIPRLALVGPRRTRSTSPVTAGAAAAARVDSDFFLATSTLDFWPGIPIRHSTELAQWTVIGHAVTRPGQYRRDGQPGPLQLYAPTLRHHDGRSHLACTNVAPGQGNFIISPDDPLGPWSGAVWVDAEGFDPSLAFDGDTAYYTRRTVVTGKEGSGPVVQAEIDVSSGRLLTPTRPITPNEAGWRSNDIEAPHLYRIGRWWYLLAAEGGTWKGHMATVGHSRSP